jgi:hypothetical protein
MNIEKKSNYTLFSSEENTFSELLAEFSTTAENHQKEHIILCISEDLNISEKDFSLFLDIAAVKSESGTSFVIVVTGVNIDNLPEEINAVPTLQEAEDILEMEAIEKELGF